MRLVCVVLLASSPWVNAFSDIPAQKTALLEKLPISGFVGDNPTQVSEICDACSALENNPSAEQEYGLFGQWKLRFTSASPYGLLKRFGGDSSLDLPNSLVNNSPLLATSVSQKVDTSARLVTSVDLAPWPALDALSSIPILGSLSKASVNLELDHSFKLLEGQLKMDVTLEKVKRTLSGAGDDLPAFIPKESNYDLPLQLRPKGTFETTYLDDTLRIDRSLGGQLLGEDIFVFERVVVERPSAKKVVEENEESKETEEEEKKEPMTVNNESVGDNCELGYEEDGTPVILCDDVENNAMPSD
mmetsp:Transcript_31876/g.46909  ORF Transcript_31876/g.46909 Transcript_31876/m.46909 type:complete len:302 (+) Transcript_31876:76-981(+)